LFYISRSQFKLTTAYVEQDVILHRPTEGIIKTLNIKRHSDGKWFASFSCDFLPIKKLPKTGKFVGIDLGITCYIQISDGTSIKNPRFFRKSEKKLANASRKFEKVKNLPRNTPKRKRAKKALNRIHAKIKNQRSDLTTKIVNKLVAEYDIICCEDLNIKEMLDSNKQANNKGSGLRKSISDASWGIILKKLAFKAEEAGKQVSSINPRGTSQTCSGCYQIVKKTLSVRVHDCPFCGLKLDRDLNASLNILRLGLISLGLGIQSLDSIENPRSPGL